MEINIFGTQILTLHWNVEQKFCRGLDDRKRALRRKRLIENFKSCKDFEVKYKKK